MIILRPITSVPVLFCCALLVTSTRSSSTRFMKGSNPHSIPWTYLPPFHFNDSSLSINFFSSGGWALLTAAAQGTHKSLGSRIGSFPVLPWQGWHFVLFPRLFLLIRSVKLWFSGMLKPPAFGICLIFGWPILLFQMSK